MTSEPSPDKLPPVQPVQSVQSVQSVQPVQVLPVEELPEEFQVIHSEFHSLLNEKKPKEARTKLRKLIAYYIDQSREIPVSIEVGYGKLLMLEEIEREKPKDT
jgi:hypothetical protein